MPVWGVWLPDVSGLSFSTSLSTPSGPTRTRAPTGQTELTHVICLCVCCVIGCRWCASCCLCLSPTAAQTGGFRRWRNRPRSRPAENLLARGRARGGRCGCRFLWSQRRTGFFRPRRERKRQQSVRLGGSPSPQGLHLGQGSRGADKLPQQPVRVFIAVTLTHTDTPTQTGWPARKPSPWRSACPSSSTPTSSAQDNANWTIRLHHLSKSNRQVLSILARALQLLLTTKPACITQGCHSAFALAAALTGTVQVSHCYHSFYITSLSSSTSSSLPQTVGLVSAPLAGYLGSKQRITRVIGGVSPVDLALVIQLEAQSHSSSLHLGLSDFCCTGFYPARTQRAWRSPFLLPSLLACRRRAVLFL